MPIIKLKKSIIPSCDVESLEKLDKLVKATCNVKGVGAYKIGFELVIPFGMEKVVKAIRKHTKLPIIYDHQKAGTDIPDMGLKFMNACKGADAVILFPQAGPETEAAWIKAAQQAKMNVIIGGEMTHKGYLKNEGGFIDDNAPKRMYEIAASLGVADFVVPGNKPDKCLEYNELIKTKIKNPVYYSPGLITQGGSISELAKKLESWHAIVGRAIYEADDMKKAAEEMAKSL
ncbi:MAG TPA: orotidine 5'-phosphate decarboxylase / HUMPS family protein [Candidatus Nanoarchaeia archaeon]|nr:orotidine 5'-phosphate decarboxylase / HUMPS family protein [Candidatus Nanoarchaeia archaeon]